VKEKPPSLRCSPQAAGVRFILPAALALLILLAASLVWQAVQPEERSADAQAINALADDPALPGVLPSFVDRQGPLSPEQSRVTKPVGWKLLESTFIDAQRQFARGEVDVSFLREVLQAAMRHDPAGALRLATQHLEHTVVVEAFALWAEASPEEAKGFVSEMPGNQAHGPYLAALVDILWFRGLEDLQHWAATLPDSEVNQSAHAAIVHRLHQDAPGGVEPWLRALPSNDARSMASAAYAKLLQESNPQTAARCVMEFATGFTQVEALVDIASSWMESDPVAASSFFLNLERTPRYDPVLAAIAQQAVDYDPEGALLWSQSISDPALRQKINRAIVVGQGVEQETLSADTGTLH